MTDEFPADVKKFLTQCIGSVAQLEMLLLLKNDAQRTWPVAEISRRLYISDEVCAQQLTELQSNGLLTASGSGREIHYQYRPRSSELERLAGQLQEIYTQRHVSVIAAIYSEPTDRVQTFADAFRIRKEK